MAKALLLNALQDVLSDYVIGLSSENLKGGVFAGKIALENLQVRRSAFALPLYDVLRHLARIAQPRRKDHCLWRLVCIWNIVSSVGLEVLCGLHVAFFYWFQCMPTCPLYSVVGIAHYHDRYTPAKRFDLSRLVNLLDFNMHCS